MTASQDRCPGGLDPELLLAYVEGDLERSARKEVEEHVRGCPFCSSELKQMSTMHSLLKSYPEAFHPCEEELYQFVALGEDDDGSVAAHLESCAVCSAEADMLRKILDQKMPVSRKESSLPAYLTRELDRVYPVRPSSGGMWATLREWAANAFGGSRLALGTAAAMLLIAVLVIPIWKTFKETFHLGQYKGSVRAVVGSEPATVRPKEEKRQMSGEHEAKGTGAPASQPGVHPVDMEKAKEKAHKQAATPAKSSVVSPDTSSGAHPARARALGGASSSSKERGGEVSGKIVPSSPEPPREMLNRAQPSGSRKKILEKNGSMQVEGEVPSQGSAQESSSKDKVAEKPGARPGTAPPLQKAAPRSDREISATAPGSQKMRAGPLVGATVLIVDSEGKAIPGLRFVAPQELRKRYRFVNGSGEKELPQEKPATSSTKKRGFAYPEHQEGAGGLVIRVRVVQSGSLYELEADLMPPRGGGVTKSVKTHDVKKDDLDRTIASLVSSLLSEASPD